MACAQYQFVLPSCHCTRFPGYASHSFELDLGAFLQPMWLFGMRCSVVAPFSNTNVPMPYTLCVTEHVPVLELFAEWNPGHLWSLRAMKLKKKYGYPREWR